MMRKVLLLLLFSHALHSFSQEKEMYAESILNKKAPVLVVEKWISDIPDTKGKFVLIDFWATWCTTYNLVIPQLNLFKTEFEND